jgi:hypothetical protein
MWDRILWGRRLLVERGVCCDCKLYKLRGEIWARATEKANGERFGEVHRVSDVPKRKRQNQRNRLGKDSLIP